MSKTLNRRQTLKSLMVSSSAYALGAFAAETNSLSKDHSTATSPSWPYQALDIQRTAELAYQYHDQRNSCMYGVFASIIRQLAEKVGQPYQSFPCEMMVYGEGGVAGWGTLCGALNGGAAAIALLVRKETERKALIDELFFWYENAELPIFLPKKPFFSVDLPGVKTNSVLCHPSVSAWIKQAKVSFYSKERRERCTRLSADTARKTVEILNSSFTGTVTKHFKLGEKTSDCLSCHGKTGVQADVMIKSCTGCHFPSKNQHPQP
jgi:hypothetical protein